MIGKKVEVSLEELCFSRGGDQEYPNGWTGKVVDVSLRESLARVQFNSHFSGLKEGGKKKERKTDDHKTIWIPFSQLALVPTAQPA